MAFDVLGATKNDLEIVGMGAQTAYPNPKIKDNGRHFIHDLHKMTPQHLTGKPLDKLTDLFIDTLCADIDAKFPEDDAASYEWQEMDICPYVKTTWAHASITSLFGTNIYAIWPGIEKWLWAFDEHFNSLMTKMPRFMLPIAWALRDEGWEKCAQWEADARKAEEDNRFGEDPDWDPYWGLRFVRQRAHYLKESGLTAKVRAGNQMVFIWGVSITPVLKDPQTNNTSSTPMRFQLRCKLSRNRSLDQRLLHLFFKKSQQPRQVQHPSI